MINNDNNITSSPNLYTHITDYTNTKRSPTISFATHNVHSLQCDLKNELIKDTFLDFNTDFVSLTETCHRSNQTYKNKHDPNFLPFGVLLLIPMLASVFLLNAHGPTTCKKPF